MKRIYLASPFFTDEQREIKARIKKHLERIIGNEYEIADPQRKGNPLNWEKDNYDWGSNTFINDITLLDGCEEVVAIDWGLYGDCGTAWEVGYAYSKDKHILVICPNAVANQPHSLMVANACDNFIIEERFFTIYHYEDLFNLDYLAKGVVQK